jgi:histidinol-phosphatase (PHP family)
VALYGHGSRGGGARGGRAITFASDAHTTDALAGNFYEAMAMAEHFGFCQGHHPEDFWTS